MVMAGGVFEGPLKKEKSSLLISFRKSYLGYMEDIGLDFTTVPETFDSQVKLTIDLSGTLQDRMFDNRYIINLRGGYKPTQNWDFSASWIWMGGAPYTPIDTVSSSQVNELILDKSRFHGARYPEYNSLNLRIDKRFNFKKSNLIIYLDIWNVFDRNNILDYNWNKYERNIDFKDQLSILPMLGVELKF